jgi:hypothetical protein
MSRGEPSPAKLARLRFKRGTANLWFDASKLARLRFKRGTANLWFDASQAGSVEVQEKFHRKPEFAGVLTKYLI